MPSASWSLVVLEFASKLYKSICLVLTGSFQIAQPFYLLALTLEGQLVVNHCQGRPHGNARRLQL
jgi:hypothetical protein